MSFSHYSILRIHPYPQRSEHLNIGIAVFRDDGIRVHLADNLKKLKAFAPGVDLDVVRGWPVELQEMLAGVVHPKEARDRIAMWGGAQQLSEQAGQFIYRDEHEYAERVAGALSRMVEPESKMRMALDRPYKSRLDLELKHAFAAYGWLGKAPEDINHRIVPHYPINEDMGIRADFAVMNGRLHVIETIDFRVASPLSKRESAQAKTLVMALAKDAVRYAIVAGGDGKESAPSIRLLESQADRMVRWEDAAAVDSFLAAMSQATGKPMIGLPTT